MAKSQDTFSKKEKEKRRQRRKQEKQQRKEERRAESKGGSLNAMIAYVDEYGNFTDTPPDPTKKRKIKAENIQVSIPRQEDLDEPEGHIGRIDFFNPDKGFGFIQEPGRRDRYFFHISETLYPVQEGDEVQFELVEGPRGLNAVQVQLVGDEPPQEAEAPEPTEPAE